MENYKRYKENNPHKTDAQIIESLVWELKDKVETIHKLLSENEALRIHDVVASAEFEKDLEKAIEEGNEVGYNADGGYNYYCEGTALREVLKVIKKHLL